MTASLDPPFIVKVCGITNEEDARVAVDAGANALGFNFYPKSARFVSPSRAHQIAASVSGTFLRVGVFVNATEQEVLEVAAQVPLDVLQLHGRCAVRIQDVTASGGPLDRDMTLRSHCRKHF